MSSIVWISSVIGCSPFGIIRTYVETVPLPPSLEGGESLGMLRIFPSSWSEPIRGFFDLKESIEV